MKKYILSFIWSLAIAFIIGGGVATVAPDSSMLSSVFINSGFVFAFRAVYFYQYGEELNFNALFAGVNKEIWLDKLKENFYSKTPWLEGVDDWSEWVEYNTLNYTIAGSNPTILKNNAVWPIVAVQRTDTNYTVVLDTYDSTTTRVRNVEEIEVSVKKLESVIDQHKKSLMQEIATECLWNYAPATAAAGAIAVTGTNRTLVIGSQSTVAATMQLDDLAGLQERWDAMEAPAEGRTVVLNPFHRRDLMKQDTALFKEFTNLKAGEALPIFGINVYTVGNTPLYTKTTLAKKAYGAAADNTNDCVASVAFINSEVMRADGTVEMFYKEKGINPEQRADEVGFQKRFKGTPQRSTNFMQIALVSNRA